MNELTLELPWPPSVNNYKRLGKIVKTKSGKLYQQRVNNNETKMFYFMCYQAAKKIIPPEGFYFAHSDDILIEVYVDLHPPHNRPYDLDNRLKCLLDGLMHANVICDDKQISRLTVEKKSMIEHGQTIVHIKEYSHDSFARTIP